MDSVMRKRNHMLRLLEIVGKLVFLVLLAFVLIIIITVLGLVLLLLTGWGDFQASINYLTNFEGVGGFLQNIGLIGASLLAYAAFELKRKWPLGLKERNGGRSFVEGCIWGIVLVTAAFVCIGALGGYRYLGFGLESGMAGEFARWLCLFVLVGISEELLTRGYIQGLVRYHYGSIAAVIVASLVFSLMHINNQNVLQNPLPLLELFLAGILLGVAREVSGGLWVPIGLHFTWNFFQGNIYGFEVSGNKVPALVQIESTGPEWLSGGSFGAEGSLITVLITALGVYAVYRWYNRSRRIGLHNKKDRIPL